MPFIILFTYKYLFEKNGNYCYFSFYLKGRKKAFCKSTLILSKLQRKYGAGGYRQPYFFMPNFENFATEERKITIGTKEYFMEENRNDIEILKAMIKENFEEQRKLIAKLETALEAVTSFNGKQMLDSRYAPDAESMRPDTDPLA